MGRLPHVPAHVRVDAVRLRTQRRAGAAVARASLGGVHARDVRASPRRRHRRAVGALGSLGCEQNANRVHTTRRHSRGRWRRSNSPVCTGSDGEHDTPRQAGRVLTSRKSAVRARHRPLAEFLQIRWGSAFVLTRECASTPRHAGMEAAARGCRLAPVNDRDARQTRKRSRFPAGKSPGEPPVARLDLNRLCWIGLH